MTIYQKYKNAEAYLESLGNIRSVDFFQGTSNPDHHFKRTKLLLKLGGNPDKGLKIIHVAGTSGKGSVVNYIYNILQKTGFNVGAHFSPFVSVATEKIQINGKFISMKDFVELVEEIKPVIEKCHQQFDMPSYFEVWHLLCLMYFKKQKCDFVVQETGCGGRYDGSNAVYKTLVSVITNIGLDHTHILGDTSEKIAYEKAGIIRQGGKVFTAVTKPKALEVIQKECDKLGADLTIVNCKDAINRVSTATVNEDLARAVTEHLKIEEKHIRRGLNEPNPIPARFEIVRKKPLVILDGAHNPDKLAYLASKILNPKFKILNKFKIQNPNSRKLHLICALGQHKKPKDCFKELLKQTDYLYVTRPLLAIRKFIDPVVIAKELKPLSLRLLPSLKLRQSGKSGVKTQVFLDPQQALEAAIKKAKPNDLILATGSFFLCSDLRKNWYSEEAQLKQRTNFTK